MAISPIIRANKAKAVHAQALGDIKAITSECILPSIDELSSGLSSSVVLTKSRLMRASLFEGSILSARSYANTLCAILPMRK